MAVRIIPNGCSMSRRFGPSVRANGDALVDFALRGTVDQLGTGGVQLDGARRRR